MIFLKGGRFGQHQAKTASDREILKLRFPIDAYVEIPQQFTLNFACPSLSDAPRVDFRLAQRFLKTVPAESFPP